MATWEGLAYAAYGAYKAYPHFKNAWTRTYDYWRSRGLSQEEARRTTTTTRGLRPLPEVPIRDKLPVYEVSRYGKEMPRTNGRRFTSHDCSRPEEKYFDSQGSTGTTYVGGVTAWNTGIIGPGVGGGNVLPTAITIGTGGNQRVGNVVSLHSIYMRFNISLPTTISLTGAYNGAFRLIVFTDSECDGNNPVTPELLTFSTIAAGALESPLDIGNAGRFTILKDETRTYASPAASIQSGKPDTAPTNGGGGAVDPIEVWFKPLKCHRVQWDDQNGNAVANFRNGHIFIMMMAHQTQVSAGVATIGTADPPFVRWTARVRFQDN